MIKPVHTPTQCVKRLPQYSGSIQTTVTTLCCKFTDYQIMLHGYYACGILKQDPHFRTTSDDNMPQTSRPLWWLLYNSL